MARPYAQPGASTDQYPYVKVAEHGHGRVALNAAIPVAAFLGATRKNVAAALVPSG